MTTAHNAAQIAVRGHGRHRASLDLARPAARLRGRGDAPTVADLRAALDGLPDDLPVMLPEPCCEGDRCGENLQPLARVYRTQAGRGEVRLS